MNSSQMIFYGGVLIIDLRLCHGEVSAGRVALLLHRHAHLAELC